MIGNPDALALIRTVLLRVREGVNEYGKKSGMSYESLFCTT